MSDEMEKAWREAVSFPGSSPPEKAALIGRIERNGVAYLLYKGDTGYYYNTVQGIRFAMEMEESTKRKKRRCTW